MEIFLSSLSHTVKLEKIILSNSIYFGNVGYLGILPALGAGDHEFKSHRSIPNQSLKYDYD